MRSMVEGSAPVWPEGPEFRMGPVAFVPPPPPPFGRSPSPLRGEE